MQFRHHTNDYKITKKYKICTEKSKRLITENDKNVTQLEKPVTVSCGGMM